MRWESPDSSVLDSARSAVGWEQGGGALEGGLLQDSSGVESWLTGDIGKDLFSNSPFPNYYRSQYLKL